MKNKCFNKYLYSFILFLILIITLYINLYINTNTIPLKQGFRNAQKDWYDPSNISLTEINKQQHKITGLSSTGNNICTFPDCPTFSGIYNSWENTHHKKEKYYTNQKQNTAPKVLLNPNKFLSYNISSPDCCQYNSNYSTSNGCLCITPEQDKFLNSRGGNNYNAFN